MKNNFLFYFATGGNILAIIMELRCIIKKGGNKYFYGFLMLLHIIAILFLILTKWKVIK